MYFKQPLNFHVKVLSPSRKSAFAFPRKYICFTKKVCLPFLKVRFALPRKCIYLSSKMRFALPRKCIYLSSKKRFAIHCSRKPCIVKSPFSPLTTSEQAPHRTFVLTKTHFSRSAKVRFASPSAPESPMVAFSYSRHDLVQPTSATFIWTNKNALFALRESAFCLSSAPESPIVAFSYSRHCLVQATSTTSIWPYKNAPFALRESAFCLSSAP